MKPFPLLLTLCAVLFMARPVDAAGAADSETWTCIGLDKNMNFIYSVEPLTPFLDCEEAVRLRGKKV